MTEFEKVGLEICKFMRGIHKLDEVAGMYYDIPCLKFRQGNIVSINLQEDHYDFQIDYIKDTHASERDHTYF